MKNNWDVIVVGGGPAGSMAAWNSAKGGASVLMLEKDREIGVPVRCGECVDNVLFPKSIKIEDKWIDTTINKIEFISPDSSNVKIKFKNTIGYILDRRVFDSDLAKYASKAGVTIKTKAYVHGLLVSDDGFVNGVKVNILGDEFELKSKIVIGADGVESRIGRMAGINTALKMEHIGSCVQAVVSGIDIEDDSIKLYVGENYVPGGYIWVFPKGNYSANIGLGILGKYSSSGKPKMYLEKFINEHFPNGSITNYVAGGVPATNFVDNIIENGIMLVGDAARTANPLTGGGINAAMHSGEIAGTCASNAIKSEDYSKKFLAEYVKIWTKFQKKPQEQSYRIREFALDLTNDDYNHIAKKALAISEEKRSLTKIFKIVIWRKPSLIFDVIKLFAGF